MDQMQKDLEFVLAEQTQFVDLEKCWMLGYEASQREQSESANPFKPNSKEFAYWQEGWWGYVDGLEALFPEWASVSETETVSQLEAANEPHLEEAQAGSKGKYIWYTLGAAFATAAVLANSLIDLAA